MESLRLQGQRWKSALPLLSSSSHHGSHGDSSPLDSLVESFRKNGSVFLSSLSVSEEPHRCRSAASHPPPHGPAAGSGLFGSATASPSHLHYYHHHQQQQQQQQGQASPNSSSCFESCDGGDVGFDSDN
ncbi:unnamed protein product, partial [Ixodes hexagonus]